MTARCSVRRRKTLAFRKQNGAERPREAFLRLPFFVASQGLHGIAAQKLVQQEQRDDDRKDENGTVG